MDTMTTSTRITTPTDTTIRIETLFDAPRDAVWRAHTEPALLERWWGRGHPLDIEYDENRRGGRWRYVEHSPDGEDEFEGRYRDVDPPKHISRTFEWGGMPGYVSLEDAAFEDLGDGTTRMVATSYFFTREERDGMLQSGMQQGMERSYAALDEVLRSLR